jgi:hypothetical protein
MRRIVALVLFAVALMLVSWSVGRAQARVASFYVTVDAPAGELKVTCSQGCDWPPTPGETTQVIVSRCERQPCRVMFNGNGLVRLEAPH